MSFIHPADWSLSDGHKQPTRQSTNLNFQLRRERLSLNSSHFGLRPLWAPPATFHMHANAWERGYLFHIYDFYIRDFPKPPSSCFRFVGTRFAQTHFYLLRLISTSFRWIFFNEKRKKKANTQPWMQECGQIWFSGGFGPLIFISKWSQQREWKRALKKMLERKRLLGWEKRVGEYL